MSEKDERGVLITGVNGFVGGHLVDELAEAGHIVFGAGREPEANDQIVSQLQHYWQADLMEPRDCRHIEWEKISSVIHLAGLAAVGPSFDNPQLYHDVNTGVIRNIFEAAELAGVKPRVIAISTGAVYGRTDGPVTEDSPAGPGSPYAESKLAAEAIVSEYRAKGFDNSVNVRPFNHAGPGQKPGFLIPDLGYQIAAGDDPVKAGNLSSSRDYTDVRDVARAYRLLVEAPQLKHDVYNVCSGSSVKGEDIFDMLRKAADKPNLQVELAQDKLRASDDDIIVGSNQRLQGETGWQPEISIDQTIEDFYESIES